MWKSQRVRRLKPVHWALVFLFFVLTLAWMLTDTSSGVVYRHSVRHSDAADRVLHLDDAYRKKIQALEPHMRSFCDRGSDIVYGHNLLVNDVIFNDYIFHVCGGQTWLNARITVKTEEMVGCQEEYASIFRSVPRAKKISMKAIDVSTWAEREVLAEGKVACVWQHAVDILDHKWAGL
tara:strand:+ start:4395 stop:4928 length:534 start_codon:yes stop_codon:yes gene_type:complete